MNINKYHGQFIAIPAGHLAETVPLNLCLRDTSLDIVDLAKKKFESFYLMRWDDTSEVYTYVDEDGLPETEYMFNESEDEYQS